MTSKTGIGTPSAQKSTYFIFPPLFCAIDEVITAPIPAGSPPDFTSDIYRSQVAHFWFGTAL